MRRGVLLVGDALVLLVFSLGGIAFHRVPGSAWLQLWRIGLPFALGYFLVAGMLGALRPTVVGLEFARRSAAAWVVGIGLGVLLRVIIEGRTPIPSFLLVTFLFTGTLLLTWRGLYWSLSRK